MKARLIAPQVILHKMKVDTQATEKAKQNAKEHKRKMQSAKWIRWDEFLEASMSDKAHQCVCGEPADYHDWAQIEYTCGSVLKRFRFGWLMIGKCANEWRKRGLKKPIKV